jgi:hypothetical protein
MRTDRQGLFNTTATTRAVLRRPVGIHCHILSPSVLGFVGQHAQEIAPTGIRDALGDVATCKPLDVQVFDGNQPKTLHDLGRFLMLKVAPLVCRMLVALADLPGKRSVLPASSCAPGPAALQSSELLFRCPEPARPAVDPLASGQSGECLQAHVDPDGGLSCGGGIRVGHVQMKEDEPVPQLVSLAERPHLREDGHFDLGLWGPKTSST